MATEYKSPPPKNPGFPSMHWHPETGENRIFDNAADIPEGWLDTHPDHESMKDKPKAQAAAKADAVVVLPMTKKDIVAALKAGEVKFDPNARAADLYAVLVTSLKDHLTDEKVSFPENATAPELLALVSKSE